MRRLVVPASLLILVAGACGLVACGSSSSSRTFEEPAPGPGGGSTGELPGSSTACTGIRCDVPSCEPGKTTVIKGDVYDPAGKTRLYNVLAYVPNEPLAPITRVLAPAKSIRSLTGAAQWAVGAIMSSLDLKARHASPAPGDRAAKARPLRR